MKIFIQYVFAGRAMRVECTPIAGTSLFECARCKKTIYPKENAICRFCAADVIVEESK
jgi:hypothetical protein